MTWTFPPEDLDLKPHEVHLWRASLELGGQRERFEATLSEDELARAARLRTPAARHEFVASRSILRGILGRYLGVQPRSLEFAYSPYGKPYLVFPPAAATLTFNASHSHGFALYALSRDTPLGIDVEKVQPDLPHTELAEHFFAPTERAALGAFPAERRPRAFFAFWTHKEAYLKALGTGLSLPPQEFAVSFAEGRSASLVDAPKTLLGTRRWSFKALSPHPEYVAALVIKGADWRYRFLNWSQAGGTAEGGARAPLPPGVLRRMEEGRSASGCSP